MSENGEELRRRDDILMAMWYGRQTSGLLAAVKKLACCAPSDFGGYLIAKAALLAAEKESERIGGETEADAEPSSAAGWSAENFRRVGHAEVERAAESLRVFGLADIERAVDRLRRAGFLP